MVILASQSPRRQELLHKLIPDFQIMPASIDETIGKTGDSKTYVMQTAQNKAADIAKDHPNELVIGCDTIVSYQGKVFGKPATRADALKMLTLFSGHTHTVFTAVVIRKKEQICSRLVPCKVTFYPLTVAEIENYLDKNEYQGKAGAYAIQGAAAIFVKEVVGDYYSIVGFPVGVVNQMLKEFKS